MNSGTNEIIENEWTHLFDVNELESQKPIILSLSPTEDERRRLAQRLGLVSLKTLKADLTIVQEQGSMIVHVNGKITAELVQSCVVTLEPVPVSVEDEFEAWFADEDAAVSLAKKRRERESKGGQVEVRMLEEHDDPEPVINGKIDMGELVTQYLSLALDPYPHAEGVERGALGIDKEDKTTSPHNPFAALKDWKDKL